jgi:hypothetical protein
MNVRTRTPTSDVRSVVCAASVQAVVSSTLFLRHGSLGILSGGIHEVPSLLRDQSKYCLIFRLVSAVIQLHRKMERIGREVTGGNS